MDLDAAMMPPDQPTSPLNVLQWNWGEAYLITGAAGHWLAQRRDNGRTLAASSPDELRGLLIRDYGDQPVPREVAP
jgi:hypothetical protein